MNLISNLNLNQNYVSFSYGFTSFSYFQSVSILFNRALNLILGQYYSSFQNQIYSSSFRPSTFCLQSLENQIYNSNLSSRLAKQYNITKVVNIVNLPKEEKLSNVPLKDLLYNKGKAYTIDYHGQRFSSNASPIERYKGGAIGKFDRYFGNKFSSYKTANQYQLALDFPNLMKYIKSYAPNTTNSEIQQSYDLAMNIPLNKLKVLSTKNKKYALAYNLALDFYNGYSINPHQQYPVK